MSILLTGYTGNVGAALAGALAGEKLTALVRTEPPTKPQQNVRLVRGSFDNLSGINRDEVKVIIHAAADTTFRIPLETLRQTNVDGTRAMLEFASRCPRLRRFMHISTVCVSGATHGFIREEPISMRPEFLNAYEQTKWEAEQLVLDSALPCEIVRLSIVVADDEHGAVHRLGALHHLIYWLWRGLIPLIPASPDIRVDLTSARVAADLVARLLREEPQPGRIVHAAAGERGSAKVTDVLDVVFEEFAQQHDAWKRGTMERPVLADGETWQLFAKATAQSGDALFARVIGDAQSFLPILLHPRIYESSLADAPAWEPMVRNTVRHLIRTNWHRA